MFLSMRRPSFWPLLLCAVVALGFGIGPYIALTAAAWMPLGVRDNPWPMELVAVAATVVSIALAVRAFQARRARAVATVCAVAALASTGLFAMLVHFGSGALPPPPQQLAIATPAPDFTLPDETGAAVSLASMRGHPTLLVFYRGYW
jgi:hypothetical protein